MRRVLTHPGWLVFAIVILWGIAGKLDEPPGGFDAEPIAPTDDALGEKATFAPMHLLCYLDEGNGSRTGARSDARVLTWLQFAQRGVAVDPSVASHHLQCVVIDN